MQADTPARFIEAFFRFLTDGEFDDSLVVDGVKDITGHPRRTFEQWAHATPSAFAGASV